MTTVEQLTEQAVANGLLCRMAIQLSRLRRSKRGRQHAARDAQKHARKAASRALGVLRLREFGW